LKADPTVGAAILKLKPGAMTEIFPLIDGQSKKAVGYTIYKLLEREPAGQREITDPVCNNTSANCCTMGGRNC